MCRLRAVPFAMRHVFGAPLINFPRTWGEQRTPDAWKVYLAHPVLFVFTQKTDKFWFAANRMRTVCGWCSAGLQSHPYIRAFSSQAVCEPFGALVYTRLEGPCEPGPHPCSSAIYQQTRVFRGTTNKSVQRYDKQECSEVWQTRVFRGTINKSVQRYDKQECSEVRQTSVTSVQKYGPLSLLTPLTELDQIDYFF